MIVAAAATAGAGQLPVKQTSRVVVGEYPIIELRIRVSIEHVIKES